MKNQFHIGQQLYCVPKDSREAPTLIEVSKIGKKWIYFHGGNSRFDDETMQRDRGAEYTPDAQIYFSKQTHDDYVALKSRWHLIVKRYPFCPPDGLTLEGIEKIEQIIEGK